MASPLEEAGVRDRRLLLVGGVSGLVLAICQVGGIVLHGSIPRDPHEALVFVAEHPVWIPLHVVLISSYAFLVAFYVGVTHTMGARRPTGVAIGGQLILVGAALGALHFSVHISTYPSLAGHLAGADAALAERLAAHFMGLHHWAHALIRISLIIMMIVATLYAATMLQLAHYKRWVAIYGLASSGVTLVGIAIADFIIPGPTGDIVFALCLFPSLGWVLAVGIQLLRFRRRIAG